MVKDVGTLRNFKGGSWDLRKDERRKVQRGIAFPERRRNSRRNADKTEDNPIASDLLRWVSKSDLDE